MVDDAVATFGRLDMAFNNAGIQVPPSDAADELAENFDRVNAINLRGVWSCMKHELRHMRAQGSGAIVNCSSLGGLVGLPSRAAYHASKHGVIGLTRSAALEYAPRGIRINAICPGTIDTPMVAEMLQKQAHAMQEIMRDQAIGRRGRGRICIFSALPPAGWCLPSQGVPQSRPMPTYSVHSPEYPSQRYTFFTEARNLLLSSGNCAANVSRSGYRAAQFGRFSWRFCT